MEIDYSQYELTKKEAYSFFVGGYLCIFAILYLFYRSFWLSLIGGLTVLLLMGNYKKWKAEKRRTLLITQFKDLLYSLSAYIAANVQISQALSGCLESLNLLYANNTPLVMELSYMVRSMSENKKSDIRLLRDFANRSHCEDIENFVQVYASCMIMGGDLEKAMRSTIEILMDKITIEREIRTLTAQKKLEGNIITAMPLIIILFLNFFSPEYLNSLYVTLLGRMVMTCALLGILLSHWMIRRMTDIEV